MTELGDSCVEAVLKIDVSATRPKVLPKLLTCDHLASVIEHQDENPKRLLLKFDAKTELPQLAGSPIHLERAEADPRPRWARNIHSLPVYHWVRCEGQNSGWSCVGTNDAISVTYTMTWKSPPDDTQTIETAESC